MLQRNARRPWHCNVPVTLAWETSCFCKVRRDSHPANGRLENSCSSLERGAGAGGRSDELAGFKVNCRGAIVTPQCDRGHGCAVTAGLLIEIEFQFHNVQFRDECHTSQSTVLEATASPVFPLAANGWRPAVQPGSGQFQHHGLFRQANRFVFVQRRRCSQRSGH